MEKRKNNKKLFAIIAGSALAFVLTIALSVSITLAYFGETATNKTSVTMGGAVFVGTTAATDGEGITMSEALKDVLPGQAVEVSAKIAVTTSAGATQSAYIAVRPTFEAAEGAQGDVDDLATALSLVTAEGSSTSKGTWVKVNGWYFLCSDSAAENSKLVSFDISSGAEVVAKATGTVPITLKNDSALQVVNATFEVVAVQGTTFDGDGKPVTGTIANSIAMFTQIYSACTITPAGA